MTRVAEIRARRYAAEVGERARAYRDPPDAAGRNAIQLDLLNATWSRSLATVPYFRELRAREKLPERFASLLREALASVRPQCLERVWLMPKAGTEHAWERAFGD